MSGKISPGLGLTAFSCGVILLYSQEVLPPLAWLLVPAAAAFCVLGLIRSSLAWGLAWVVWVACGLMAGMAWAAWHGAERLDESLPSVLEGEVLEVRGYLCEIPSRGSFNSVRFGFCVQRWQRPDNIDDAQYQRLPRLLRLSWYGDEATLDPGHRLRLQVALKRPHGSVNPAGFRYESWLFRQGYRATGTIRAAEPDHHLACSLHCRYQQWRGELAEAVGRHLANADHYPLVASLLIGHRGEMTDAHWWVLKSTGTIHLVAISGLHLGLVAIGVGFLVRRSLLFLPARHLTPSRIRGITFGAVVLGSLTYALAAGFTVPTRRALIMVVAAGWIILNARQVSPWRGWTMALFLVLVLDPFSPLDQGFWLSFTAVLLLILVFSRRLGATGWLPGLVLAQGAVFAGLWPVLAALGQPQAVTGLAANLFAIPWVSLVVMPVLMAGALLVVVFPGVSETVIQLFDAVLEVLWWGLSHLAALEAPELHAGFAMVLAFAVLGVVLLVVPASLARAASLGCLVVWGLVLLAGGNAPGQNRWVEQPELWVWDVGQGLSVMLRHQDQVLLYDTGPELPGVYSAVESVLVPSLEALGVGRIDHLVISHGDSDHAGGLPLLYRRFEVAKAISGEPDRVAQRYQGGAGDKLADGSPGTVPEFRECAPGTELRVGQIRIRLWRDAEGKTGNDASCVAIAWVKSAATEILLPGDITHGVERSFLAQAFNQPGNDVDYRRIVIAPHHGSKTSSSREWVTALAPWMVIYSAGYRHRFGHPHPAVVDRYRQAESLGLNTAHSGAIRLTLGQGGVTVKEARDDARFWIRPPDPEWHRM